MAKDRNRLELIIERQGATATCVEHNHGLPESKATHLVMEDIPWLLEQIAEIKNGLKEIINHNPIVYNGRSDRAGDMERMAQRLLNELEK